MLQRSWLRGSLEKALGWTAFLLPTVVAFGRIAVDSSWRDDLASVRGLALVPVGGACTVSAMAMQLALAFPIGPLPFRLALISVLGLGLCSWLLQSLARRLLEIHIPGSILNAPLACVTALIAALGPGLQGEGTVGGGATVGLALCLAVLVAFFREDDEPWRRAALCGLGLAAVLAESWFACAALLLALGLAQSLTRRRPDRKALLLGAAAFGLVGLLLHLPVFLRPAAPHVALNVGWTLWPQGLVAIDTAARATSALSAWRNEIGVISMCIAAIGGVIGLARFRTRSLVAPLVLLILADVLMPATSGAVLTIDPLMPLRMLAICSLAMTGAIGVQTVATTLLDMQLPWARGVAVMVVMFDVTLVAVASEQATFSVDRSEQHGASVFAEEALEKLEPNAMVLARSHALVWRLLNAQLVYGARPDVVLVPFPLVDKGQVSSRLMVVEPSVALLLRDLAVDGIPSEHAVSRIADRRPLYVELDPSWDSRVANHLVPEGLWLRLLAQPLGSSDRRLALASTDKTAERVITVARKQEPYDRATSAVVLASLRQQAVACALARDKASTRALVERIQSFEPEDLFARALTQRLEHARGPQIDVAGLLH